MKKKNVVKLSLKNSKLRCLLRRTADKSATNPIGFLPSWPQDLAGRLLPDHDLVFGEGNLGAGVRYVTHAVGRLHLADGHGTLVVYPADEQRLAVLGLAPGDRVRRDVTSAYRHPYGPAAAKDLRRETKLDLRSRSLQTSSKLSGAVYLARSLTW